MGSVVKRYDMVAGRKYESKGETKTHWIQIGEAAEWDDGNISGKLFAAPCGNWFDGSFKLFDKDRDKKQSAQKARTAGFDDDPDF